MVSKFGWVDFAEEDRKKMLDVVQLFRERDTRDELGIGTIRDAFSDHFFPGTSTIQTRVKYLLYVPWIYQGLEKKRVSTGEINLKARREEVRLIYSLLENGESEGVIGREAKKNLIRLASNVYWSGLESWGIRIYPGSQDQYHRYLDTFYSRHKKQYSGESDSELSDRNSSPNWHDGLPDRPKNMMENATLGLSREEAEYLKDRVLTRHPKSFLAKLTIQKRLGRTNYPWQHSIAQSLPKELQVNLWHARNFSEVISGAFLLYNLMLSQAVEKEDWIERYEEQLANWAKAIAERQNELKNGTGMLILSGK